MAMLLKGAEVAKALTEGLHAKTEELKKNGVKRVEKGVFGADMKVSLINDGPVTICFDTDVWSGK